MRLLTLAGLLVLAFSKASAEDVAARIDRLLAEAEHLGSRQVLRNDLALPLCREAARLADRSRDDARAARAWSALGMALWELNRFDEAGAALDRARALARRTRQRKLEATVLRRLGTNLFSQAAFQEADRTLQEALAVAGETEDRQEQVAILNTLSVNARHQGRLAEAEARARQALQLLDRLLAEGRTVASSPLFQVPFNVGKSLAEAGDYGSAIAFFDRAFAAAQATGLIGGQWHALHDSAEWYLAQGDLERAARYFERALKHSRAHRELRESEAYTLRGLGALAEARGDFAGAASKYAESAEMFRGIGLPGRAPMVLAALARVQSKTGASLEATKSAREALRLATAQGQPLGQALARLELARQHSSAALHSEAEREYARVLEVARANGLRPLESATLAGLAGVSRERGDTQEAIRLYRAAADTIEGIRGRIVSPDLRAVYANATHATYSGLFDILIERHNRAPQAGHDVEALLALERQRSQNLLEALSEASAGRRREVPAALRQRRQELEGHVAELQIQLSSDATSASRRRELLARLDDGERALAAIEGEGSALRKEVSRTAPVAWMDPQSWEPLQRRLEPREALVEYAPRLAFVVTRAALKVVELEALPNLDGRIEFFTRMLAGPRPEDALPAGRALARALVAPVLAAVPPGTTRLIFGASGALAGLPFAALPHPLQPETGRPVPLLEEYEIAYVPSLTALAHLRSRPSASAPRQLLAVAGGGAVSTPVSAWLHGATLGPLPHSRREVQSIARRVQGRTELLIEPAASEAALKARPLRDFGVLHFATHAVLDPEVPSRSAILLAQGGGEDGLLQSREIYGLDLTADIVVLSACRTAAGRISSAEGMESLARAFLYAGGRAVVGTLWDVEDEAAADAVERLYDALAEGRPAGEAVREAQLSLLGDRPYARAGAWAAFLLTGDPSVRVSLGPPSLGARLARESLRFASIAGGLALGLGIWIRARRRQGAAA